MSVLERPLRLLATSRLARAATWPHGVDGFAGVLDTSWSSRTVRARIAGIRRQTADTVTLDLRPNGNWQGHQAGQHVLLSVEVDGVRQSRCFSVASAPGDRSAIELTCKVGPDSIVARHLPRAGGPRRHRRAEPGPGEFALEPATGRPLVLLSAGSGITPVLSMLRYLDGGPARRSGHLRPLRPQRRSTCCTGPRSPTSWSAPGWRSVTVTEHDDAGDLHGRFRPDHLAAIGIRPRAAEAYACGPQPLMDSVAAAWRGAGARPAASTPSPTVRRPCPRPGRSGAATGTIRFARSGIEVPNDGRSILEQAEAAGIRPAHGCRRGICHTCVVPRASGCVRVLGDGTVEAGAADVAGTPVRICTTTADGDVELDL